MERRDFLKTSCSLCMGIGAGVLIGSLSSCASHSVYRARIVENTITLPKSLFDDNNVHIVRPDSFAYDIAVQKENDETFSALLLRCTHADNQLNYTGNGYSCNLHGSKFDLQGDVTRGPAQHQLKKLVTHVHDNTIIISIS